jgi:predicted nuclease with TOPRIM domain
MNNLTSFADFAKGNLKEQLPKAEPVSKPVSVINEPQTEDLEAEVDVKPMEKTKAGDKKFKAHHEKLFGTKKPHEHISEENEEMKPFRDSYEVVEKEFTSLLRELNRVESGKPDLKKDVTELKKHFNELLVKLQFFGEYTEPVKTEEK